MNRRSLLSRCVFLALLGLALSSCGRDGGWPEDAGPERPLRFGLVLPESADTAAALKRIEPFLLALSEATGLKMASPLVTTSPGALREALEQGQADFAFQSVFEFEEAEALALPWIARTLTAVESLPLVLLVAENSAMRAAADLAGAVIGITTAGRSPMEAEPFLLIPDLPQKPRVQIYSNDVKTLVALAEGEVQAAVIERATHERVVKDRMFTSTRFRALTEYEVSLGGALYGAKDLNSSLLRALRAGLLVIETEPVSFGFGSGEVQRFAAKDEDARSQKQSAEALREALKRRSQILTRGRPTDR